MADQFDSDLGDDILDAAPSSVFESPVITLANILVPSTYVAYLDPSFCEIRYRSSSSGTFNSYSTSNQNGVISGGQFQLQLTAPSTYSTLKACKVTLFDNRTASGGVATFGQILLRTQDNPSGTSAGLSGGSSNFGIQILGPTSPQEIVWSTSMRTTNTIVAGTLNLSAGQTSSQINCEGLTASNTDEIGIQITGSATSLSSTLPLISRFGGFFTVTNQDSQNALSVTYIAVRY